MNNFTLVPTPNYVGELLRLAPGFAASREYQSLDEVDRTITGLVFSTFAKFMEASFGNQQVIAECVGAIEHFAAINDHEAQNYIITEVFEAFRKPELSKNLLLPKSRRLYDRWIGG
jgi:hypothetical protein